MHREQNATVNRLQTIAHVGQSTPDDDAHGVIKIRAPHLLFEADRQRFLGELIHQGGSNERTKRVAVMRGGKGLGCGKKPPQNL